MTNGVVLASTTEAEAQPAIVSVYAVNFAEFSATQPAVIEVFAHGAARIDGELFLGSESVVGVFASTADATVRFSLEGEAIVDTYGFGAARVDGELLLGGETTVSVFASEPGFSDGYGEATLPQLSVVGAESADYTYGEATFEALTSDGNVDDFNLEYAIGDAILYPLISGGLALEGSIGEGEATLEPLISIGASYPYAQADGVLPALTTVGYETITYSQSLELTQPASEIDGTGVVQMYGAELAQPASEVDGLGAWSHLTLDQPKSALEIQATNPAIGRFDKAQPGSRIEATGLTGKVGAATLDQPRSTLTGQAAWEILLDGPGSRIEAEGLVGRIGEIILDQPRSRIEAEATQTGVGNADLTQPRSELVQNTRVELTQPESLIAGAGVDESIEVADIAYAVNYDHGAVTTYDSFTFNQIAEFCDAYYAVGPNGVYRIEPFAGDDGAAIRSEVRFAQQEQGGQRNRAHLTKITYLYLMVDSKEAFDALLTTGEGYERTYRVQQRDGQEAHTRRVRGAKGVKARTWGAGLIHEGTEHFRLYDVEMVGEVLQRKV